jgi:hypothetical protein
MAVIRSAYLDRCGPVRQLRVKNSASRDFGDFDGSACRSRRLSWILGCEAARRTGARFPAGVGGVGGRLSISTGFGRVWNHQGNKSAATAFDPASAAAMPTRIRKRFILPGFPKHVSAQLRKTCVSYGTPVLEMQKGTAAKISVISTAQRGLRRANGAVPASAARKNVCNSSALQKPGFWQ